MADQRQKIIASVFSRRNATGNLEEAYVSHVKIWEDAGPEGGGKKPRYILLSQASNGSGFIHKSKLNTNGTFSVGKTWRLPELRAIHVVNSLSFNITLSRTYRWQTENQADQASFLEALIQLFHTVAPGSPLQVEGFPDTYKATDIIVTKRSSNILRPRTPNHSDQDHERLPSPTPPPSRLRAGSSSRAASPRNGDRTYPPPAVTHRETPVQQPSLMDAQPQPSSKPSRQGKMEATKISVPAVNVHVTSRPQPPTDLSQGIYQSSGTSFPTDDFSLPSPYATSPQRSRPPSPASFGARKQSSRSAVRNNADVPVTRREQNTRISFYDPANQAAVDRLLSGEAGISVDVEGEDENALATMSNVEEMIEGYEWASDDVITRKSSRGAADLIEARLLDELMALEKANIHSFLESDDRINIVLKYLDDAISELDNMDSLVSSYKIHLNTVSEDILYIQSQNRGLQVQTQNQRALLNELENLLQTVNVDQQSLITLTQESLEKLQSMHRLEEAAAQLYKALQVGRDTDMAATMERLQEYRTHNVQFCKRILDFLSIMLTAQSTLLLGDSNGVASAKGRTRPSLVSHEEMESYLGRYSGLMLYLKEMDEKVYAKLCAAYFSISSGLHSAQMKTLFSIYINFVKKASEEGQEHVFSSTAISGVSKGAAGMRRAGTIIRSPIEGRNKDKDKTPEGDLRASEAFGLVLEQIGPAIHRENEFIKDFLQINDAGLTFADYMGLDSYFRRQATRAAGLTPTTVKLVRGAMDLIFGFLPAELKAWLDHALAKDSMEIIGMLACLERFLVDAEDRGNQFLLTMLEKQHTRLKGIFERHVVQQITDIEQTKLSSKKRQGVAHFVKQFPAYVGRVENQLIGADGLEIRTSVDAAYEKIVQSIFDSLKQMAKMDGEGEDKGQLNYHVILIENMHHFVAETSVLEVGAVAVFCRRAEAIYDENLNAYVKIVLRRPFARIIDYFEGVERLLKTTAPTEVADNSIYNKSALRKVVREYTSKDLRKQIDALFLRVAKHFSEASGKTTTEDSGGIVPGTVLVGVWKACEEELLRITDLFNKRISQCYGNTGISLEYTAADVEVAFRRHRVGS
ncbi:putative exocyst complex component SEC3 N-terminal PIP2 binding PH [Lyophyllum shimeji]|uniref:Exocyst complex component SEC3 N-terminal PIP2 binding PH n=1 Tax=Lyophyllum shimeji TaxID=47721 RepID=A0A9P3PHD7_LYOSH|nr:putative exocyst complex component SEC3 N-terminal PIP2 binding PH [Lyophyllum shimeji]